MKTFKELREYNSSRSKWRRDEDELDAKGPKRSNKVQTKRKTVTTIFKDDKPLMKNGKPVTAKNAKDGYALADKLTKDDPKANALTYSVRAVPVKESIEEARQDSAKDVYWQSYSLAIRHALAQTKKKGYEVDQDDIDREISFGSGKPGRGKTVRHTLKLTKGGKPQKKALHIQVYNRDTDKSPFELNFYIS